MSQPSKQPQQGDIRRFTYDKPVLPADVELARSPVLTFQVLYVKDGEVNVPAHAAAEHAYLVLAGGATLYEGTSAMAVLGPMDGVYLPRGAACRIAAKPPGNLEVLRIEAIDSRPDADRPFAPQGQPRVIRYDSPDLGDALIKVPYLVEQTDMLGLSVEKVRDGGGDDTFHTHSGTDSVWYVLRGGRARFRNPDGSEIVVRSGDGVFIPRMAAYGFAALDHEPSEVLHVKVRDLSVRNERIDY